MGHGYTWDTPCSTITVGIQSVQTTHQLCFTFIERCYMINEKLENNAKHDNKETTPR